MSEDVKKVGDAERVASEVAKETAQSSAPSPGLAPTGTQQAFRNIQRQLSDDHLANPGVQKLILAELDQAKSDLEALKGYEIRFHETDKRAAVLEEQLKAVSTLSHIFNLCIGIGGVLIGVAFSIKGYEAIVIAIIGIALFLVPILSRKSLK